MRLRNLAVGLVSRVPARVQTKLLVAFLAMVALIILLCGVGLQVLSGMNARTEELIEDGADFLLGRRSFGLLQEHGELALLRLDETFRSRTSVRSPSAAWLDSRGSSSVASDTVMTECGTIVINIAFA